jgi:predicted ferric reductase
MAVANLVLVVFLSLKNTPLSFLTPWSYERLNVIHQIVGYTLMITVIIHGCSYASYFGMTDNLVRLRVKEEIFGIIAGFSMLSMVVAAAIVRRFWYELFYVVHLLFFVVGLIFIGLHQPEIAKKILIAVLLAGSMFFVDRFVRLARVISYSVNNSATVHPLPNGGTRIVLRKPPRGAASGAHSFLWIPAIRKFETHPFTMASTSPLEFVVSSYDGFTYDLHKYAVEHPGASLKASVEGPYGTFPNPLNYDRVVLVAGGSGASFTFGMVNHLLKKMAGSSQQPKVEFIWMVRNQGKPQKPPRIGVGRKTFDTSE